MKVLSVEVAPADTSMPGLVALALPVSQGPEGPVLADRLPSEVAAVPLPTSLDPAWCSRLGFAGKPGQTLVLGSRPGVPVLVLVGTGPAGEGRQEPWRRAAAAFVRCAGEGGTAAFVVPARSASDAADPGGAGGPDDDALGEAIAEGAVLASYRFDEFRSSSRPAPVERLVIVRPGEEGPSGALAGGVERGTRSANAVVSARDLINTPPSDLPPRRFAERVAEQFDAQGGLKVSVWDESRIAEERLGGLLGVSRGSAEPPRLVRAEYVPTDPLLVDGRVPHVALVGKGITFDSGGLSLKTADGMTTMKTDMSGAAIVLMTLAACRDLGVRIRVSAIAPLSENMPGGRAIKPGDVLAIRNGSTVEVLNTDAEGRLVLADALVLAAELEPDAIIDVATLTGAAAVALGTSIAALFGNDEDLVARLRSCGEQTGEWLWPMPLPEEYADHIDSDVADMKNIGKPGQAGAIAAALLLARFVGGTPWAHLDIAGTGRSAESSGYLSKGGTAFGVRTLLRFLRTYAPD